MWASLAHQAGATAFWAILESHQTSPRHELPALPVATGIRRSRRTAMSHTRSICEQTAQDTVADMHGGRRPQCSKAVCNEDRDSWKTQPMRPGLNLPRFLCISFSFLFDTMPLLPKLALVPARPLNPLLFRNETKALRITSLTNRQRLFNRFLMHC